MPRFTISITYEKTIDASTKEEAEQIIEDISYKSNLDTEYGPFSSSDVFTEVEEIKEDE